MLPDTRKSFREELHGTVFFINNDLNLIGIKMKSMKGAVMKYALDRFKHATVLVTKSDTALGSTALITTSANYDKATAGPTGFELTLDNPIANLDTGDKVRLRWELAGLPLDVFPSDFYGCGFGAETPKTTRFPAGLVTTFHGGSLINCILPIGSTAQDWVENGQTKSKVVHENHALQNNLEYYKVDESLKPVSPVRADLFDKHGVSKDPADISGIKLTESPIDTAINALKGV